MSGQRFGKIDMKPKPVYLRLNFRHDLKLERIRGEINLFSRTVCEKVDGVFNYRNHKFWVVATRIEQSIDANLGNI